MLHNKTFAPEFCSLISNWFDMREQAPGANLLHDSVSWASSLVCTEICFAGACFRSKLPRVYWLGYLPGSVSRERVSGASSFVCTGWSTYPGACFGSVFQEQAPSCVPAALMHVHIKTLEQSGLSLIEIKGINPLVSIISTCNRNTISHREPPWSHSDHAFVRTRRTPRFSGQYSSC